MLFALVIHTALIGCSSAPVAWTDPSADDDWSAAIDAPEHRAEWDADGVAAAFDLALSHGFPTSQIALADFAELMTHADTSCPNAFFAGGFLELGGCVSTEGYTYRGSAGLAGTDTRVYATDGTWTGEYSLMFAPADYVILRPDGTELDAGGNATIQIIQDDHGSSWNMRMTGTFMDAGMDASEWLAAGFSGDVSAQGRAGSGVEQTIEGSLSVGGAAVAFSGLEFNSQECPDGATSGTIGIRQPDSTWYQVVLPAGCGSCGAATWNGADDIGEVCLDLQAVIDSAAAVSTP